MQSTIAGRRRLSFAAVSGMLFVVLAAGPVFADKELGHTGQVGQHSLRDTFSQPGVECRYKEVSPSPGGYPYEAKLKYMFVRPPRVRAIAGVQNVGWGFIVQRTRYTGNGWGPWITTYQSPIQRMSTNATQDAPFTQKSINVVVPGSGIDGNPYGYRVVVKMFWYQSDGSTQGLARHRVTLYNLVNRLNNGPEYVVYGRCDGWVIDS